MLTLVFSLVYTDTHAPMLEMLTHLKIACLLPKLEHLTSFSFIAYPDQNTSYTNQLIPIRTKEVDMFAA